MRVIFLFCCLFFSRSNFAQKITGVVKNESGEVLPYASITIKNSTIGASTNTNGKYSLVLEPGRYTLVCQLVGYSKLEKAITVNQNDLELDFILLELKLAMKEVVIKQGQDPALQIIKNAIKKRTYYSNQVQNFSCGVYTKDLIKLGSLPQKIFGQKIETNDRKNMGLDSNGKGIVYLSESISKVYVQQPDKFKLEVMSSRVSGSDGFGFSFPTFISLYKNNVTLFTERFNPRGFISPIADGAFGYYQYKYLGSFYEDGKEVNSIRVTPRRKYEPLFTGILNITETDWRIHSFDLFVTKTAQLEIADTLQITQLYVPVEADIWRIKNQMIHFSFNQLMIKAAGNFVSVYSNYNLHPIFPKKFFDKVLISYDTAVNKRSKTYWDSIRPITLAPEENRDYLVKDSIQKENKAAAAAQKNPDSLRKKQGKIASLQILIGGINRTHYSKKNSFRWGIKPLLTNLQYNSAEGLAPNLEFYYSKNLPKIKTILQIEPTIRYGFSNTHWNAFANIRLRTRDLDTDKKLKRESWYFSGGKRVTQFNRENPITPLANSISTLWGAKNYMKIYENWFGSIGFSKRYESGLNWSIFTLYEDRIPLANTTTFTLFKKDTVNFTPNFPYEKITGPITRHQAVQISFDISIKPGQKYIQFPRTKVPIGSKYPTFSFNYTKGIPDILGSDANFDKWKFTIRDDKNLKILGLLKYKIGVGGFIQSKKVTIPDYHHFNGNRFLAASDYVNSFQLAKYYAYSNTNSFFTWGHVEHHFNGLLTNKIPFLKKLNWNLVGGSNAFYVNKTNCYIEVFGGIENIFKLFRVDVVTGFAYGQQSHTAIRIGTGGLLGGSIRRNRNNSVSVQF